MPIIFQEMAQSRQPEQPEQPEVLACLPKERVLELWGRLVGTCGLAIKCDISDTVFGALPEQYAHFNNDWESHRALFTALKELTEGIQRISGTYAERNGFALNVRIGNAIYTNDRHTSAWRFHVSYAGESPKQTYTLIALTQFELSQRKFILS